MMNTKNSFFKPVLVYLPLTFVASLGCKDDPASPGDFTITVTVSNLKRLEPGEGHYEAWISFPEDRTLPKSGAIKHGDESFVSIGKFNLASSGGSIVSLSGQAMTFTPHHEVDINLAVDAIITIELEGDSDDDPGSRLMGGGFTGSDREANATLTTRHQDVFNFDYTTTTAVYVLTTPTTVNSSDFNSGIWWMTPGSTNSAGINQLKALADTSGWRYEGWVIDNAGAAAKFYSTGKFLAPAGADSDLAGDTAGPEGNDGNGDGRGDGFPFPGQDFIHGGNQIPGLLQLDSGSFEARITLEPEPDNSPLPFELTILSDPVIGPNISGPLLSIAMENRALSTFPTATIKINR